MNPQEKALNLCQKFGWVGIKHEQTNYTTLDLEIAKELAIIAVENEYNAKIQAYNEMAEFCPDIASQAVFFAEKERYQVKQEIEKL